MKPKNIIITEEQLKQLKELFSLNEALPLDKAKQMMGIKRDETIIHYIDNFFNCIKSKYNGISSKRGDRIYIDFEVSNDDIDVESDIKKEVETTLSNNNYSIVNYKKGLALKNDSNQQIGIGKVLNKLGNKDLLNKFSSDTVRSLSKQTGNYIVFSKHPYDIAGMSTDRGWTSCMNLIDGENCDYVPYDVEGGALIAYLIKKDDLNINNPLARLLLKPYFNQKDQKNIIFVPSNNVYGTAPSNFKQKIEEISNSCQNIKKVNNYEKTYSSYNDYNEGDVINFNTKEDIWAITPKDRIDNSFELTDNLFEITAGDGLIYLINNKGELLYNEGFKFIDDFVNGFARIRLNNKFSFIDEYGNLIGNGKLWFDRVYPNPNFGDGFGGVELNNKTYYIDTNGNFYNNKKQPIKSPFQESKKNNNINSKKIIITEQQLNLIKQNIEMENIKLPDFIKNSIKQHKTSLGNHPSFPNNIDFEESLLKKRFFELTNNVKKINDIKDISKKDLIFNLNDYVTKCRQLEEPIKNELEKICFDFVNSLFDINEGDLNIECNIVEKVKNKQPITPKPLLEFEFNDMDHSDYLMKQVIKRRLINSLVQGFSFRFMTKYEDVIDQIYKLNPKLLELYYNIINIGEYLNFTTEQVPSEETISGTVSVDLTKDEPTIKSEAIIFPLLVFETIKGVMELVSAHGLPEDRREAEYIINEADFLLAENWDKRFGVGMFDIINKITNNVENIQQLLDIFTELVMLEPDEFNNTMKEILGNTKKGKEIINNIINELSTNNNFNEFEKVTKKASTGVGNNIFFSPEELMAVNETTTTFSAGNYQYDAPAFGDTETNDHSNLIQKSIEDGNKSLKEEKDYYDFFNDMSSSVSDLLYEFQENKNRGITRKKWKVIPSNQYKTALQEFVKYGEFMRFPTKYIYQWEKIIIKNTLSIDAGTQLFGHTSIFPSEEVLIFLGYDEESDEWAELYNNFDFFNEKLDEIGFYDWMTLPDGSDAISDYGLDPLFKLLRELEDKNTAEEKIVVINKILDVYHQRGDLASAFIEGGSKSLYKISNESKTPNNK